MLRELRADVARFPGSGAHRLLTALRTPGFYPLVLYRLGSDVYRKWPRGPRGLGKVFYKLAAFFAEWATGISIAPDAQIGPGLYIGHWGCIRIGSDVHLGECCNISPMVVMGVGRVGGKIGTPWLGDRVYVAAGAKIIGPIRIGHDVAIGANAVVCRDVPDHVSVGGVPAKIISRKGSAPYLKVGQDHTGYEEKQEDERAGRARSPEAA
jgi:serine O-acetyltransferase